MFQHSLFSLVSFNARTHARNTNALTRERYSSFFFFFYRILLAWVSPLSQCPRCNKGYRWLRNMKNHLRIECGKDPKECCPYCPHRTKYKSSLQKHILRIHFG
ncbi:Longitudinals lacking protein, isoform G [Anthophora quadrimaculata]